MLPYISKTLHLPWTRCLLHRTVVNLSPIFEDQNCEQPHTRCHNLSDTREQDFLLQSPHCHFAWPWTDPCCRGAIIGETQRTQLPLWKCVPDCASWACEQFSFCTSIHMETPTGNACPYLISAKQMNDSPYWWKCNWKKNHYTFQLLQLTQWVSHLLRA